MVTYTKKIHFAEPWTGGAGFRRSGQMLPV
jgi:hypothetical protein